MSAHHEHAMQTSLDGKWLVLDLNDEQRMSKDTTALYRVDRGVGVYGCGTTVRFFGGLVAFLLGAVGSVVLSVVVWSLDSYADVATAELSSGSW